MKSYCWLLIIPIIFLFSCSKSLDPVNNSLEQQSGSNIENLSGADILANPDYRNVFGMWELRVELETETAELVPARNASKIGDIFDADLSQFLLVSPCANCLWLKNISVEPEDYVWFDISMKHPFADAVKRPDLHAFDVRAIFFSNSEITSVNPNMEMINPDGSNAAIVPGTAFVLNADGYTSHYSDIVNDTKYFISGTTLTANVFPFIRYFEDYSDATFDPALPAGHNVMPVGSSVSTKKIKMAREFFEDSNYKLFIVADMAYGQSATFANRTNPQYYLPAFHRTEPWRIEYWYENNNLDESVIGSSADLYVQVFDWQHGATVDQNYPDPANLTGIPESSMVKRVEASFADMMTANVVVTSALSGDGSVTNPLTCQIHLENQTGVINEYGFIAVRDELYGAESPSGRQPIPVSPAGFPYATLDIRDYSYYQIIKLPVPYTNGKPVDYGDLIHPDLSSFHTNGGEVTLNAEFYSDPAGTRYQYDWDYDFDGYTFDVEGSGMPSPDHTYTETGVHSVGLKVKTTAVPPRVHIFTIPLLYNGVDYNMFADGGAWSDDLASSLARSNAVGMTDDRFYAVYMSKESGLWDIKLAVFEFDGTVHTHQITNASTSNYFDPSIAVVEESGHEGIYVTFISKSGTNYDIYSTYGDLDGGGFFATNIQPVANSATIGEVLPLTVYLDGSLYTYYVEQDGGNYTLRATTSTDNALTWTGHTDIDPWSTKQYRFSVAQDSNQFVIVYEDSTDYTDRGYDLYLTKSAWGNPLSFSASKNISLTQGKFNEVYPSVAARDGITYVAYSLQEVGSVEKVACLMTISAEVHTNHVVRHKMYEVNFNPAIQLINSDSVIMAYATRNTSTNDLDFVVVNLRQANDYGRYLEYEVYAQEMGNYGVVTIDFNPGISFRGNGVAGEIFCVVTDLVNGRDHETVPVNRDFGDLKALNVVRRIY